MPSTWIILTTTCSDENADTIANALLESGHKCIQMHQIRSLYTYKGKLHDDIEIKLECKIKLQQFNNVAELIRKHHTYELPEILAYSIDGIENNYNKWLESK